MAKVKKKAAPAKAKSTAKSSAVKTAPKPSKSVSSKSGKLSAVKLAKSDKIAILKKSKLDKTAKLARVEKSNGVSRPVEKTPAPKPKPMTAEMRAIRERLVTMLGDLRKDIDHEVRGASERDLAHINDTSDMATDAAEGDLALRIAESETVEATEIERAIDKLDNGTYGTCENCSAEIPFERLQFLPFATLCVRCQELADIRRKDTSEELDDLNTDGGDGDE